jgi:hypothetical protein
MEGIEGAKIPYYSILNSKDLFGLRGIGGDLE